MDTFLIGLTGLIVGTLVAAFGTRLFFVLLPLWAFVAGFLLAGEAVAMFLDAGFLATAIGWAAGIGLGLLLAAAAGLFWWAAIVILAVTVGATIGSAVLIAIGFEPGVVPFLGGLAAGVALAVLAIVVDAPVLVVMVLTALGGSAYAVAGAWMLLGQYELGEIRYGVVDALRSEPLAFVLWLAAAVVALSFQMVEARTRKMNLLSSVRVTA